MTKDSIVSGTLVAFIRCRDGLVVCGDTKSYIETSDNYFDGMQKIYQLNETAGFATFGAVLIKRGKLTVFDAVEVLQSFNKEQPFSNTEMYWDRLNLRFQDKFGEYIDPIPHEFRPPTRNPSTSCFFHIIFFFLENNNFKITVYYFLYNKERGLTYRQFHHNAEQRFGQLNHFLEGHQTVYEEIRTGNDARFNDLRNSPVFRRFIFENLSEDETTVEDTLNFGEQLMVASNERQKLLNDPSPIIIGREADVAIIRRSTGFGWLKQQDYSKHKRKTILQSIKFFFKWLFK